MGLQSDVLLTPVTWNSCKTIFFVHWLKLLVSSLYTCPQNIYNSYYRYTTSKYYTILQRRSKWSIQDHPRQCLPHSHCLLLIAYNYFTIRHFNEHVPSRTFVVYSMSSIKRLSCKFFSLCSFVYDVCRMIFSQDQCKQLQSNIVTLLERVSRVC